jgi:hypothetical protein
MMKAISTFTLATVLALAVAAQQPIGPPLFGFAALVQATHLPWAAATRRGDRKARGAYLPR